MSLDLVMSRGLVMCLGLADGAPGGPGLVGWGLPGLLLKMPGVLGESGLLELPELLELPVLVRWPRSEARRCLRRPVPDRATPWVHLIHLPASDGLWSGHWSWWRCYWSRH